MAKKTKVDYRNELRIKGMIDYAGHEVVMKQVDKNKKVWWIWSDGAVTQEGFKRDRLFNILFKLVHFYRHNKTLLKIISILFVMFFICYIVAKYL